MSKEKNIKSIQHNLKFPVSVSVNGDVIEAQSIEIFAPTNKFFKYTNIMDTEFNISKSNAMKNLMGMISPEKLEELQKVDRKNVKNTEEEYTPNSLIAEMLQNGANIEKCFDALKTILTSNTVDKTMCLIDTVKMKPDHFDELSVIDTKEILGKYMINFLGISRSM